MPSFVEDVAALAAEFKEDPLWSLVSGFAA